MPNPTPEEVQELVALARQRKKEALHNSQCLPEDSSHKKFFVNRAGQYDDISKALQHYMELQHDYDRAMEFVRFCGVPEQRAKHLSRGLEVLQSRMSKEIRLLEGELHRTQEAQNKFKKRLHWAVSCITQSKHSNIDGNDLIYREDVYKVIKKMDAGSTYAERRQAILKEVGDE